MTMNDLDLYQAAAARTMSSFRLWNGDETQKEGFKELLAVMGLGVAGEAGEVADLIKKIVGHDHELDKIKLVKELGDVLWYVAIAAGLIGYELSEVADLNIKKLRERYPNGFSSQASINRKAEESVAILDRMRHEAEQEQEPDTSKLAAACEVHFHLMPDGICTCSVAPK